MSALPAVVYATPAAMVEHGARLRSAWSALRRWAGRQTDANGRVGRARRLSAEENARQRLVAHTLEAIRAGALAEVAVGGPLPR